MSNQIIGDYDPCPSSSYRPCNNNHTYQSYGINGLGNVWCNRGGGTAPGGSFYYSNADGSYFYQNSDVALLRNLNSENKYAEEVRTHYRLIR
ncbi:16430_t:CDS:2 [Rhizophagus irregularis]|nr:16430_t:CDS:2 [Rhizophagus irregularis]